MSKQKRLWVEYDVSATQKILINLHDTEGLYDFLSKGGTKAPVWEGDLDISDCRLEKLPDLSRIEVAGTFNVVANPLKTMKGSPYRVGGDYIANRTRFGDSIEGVEDSVAFMEGFPAKGIGGNLEIVLTHFDTWHKASEEERAPDREIVRALQEKVGGKVWTSAILFDEQRRIDDEMRAIPLTEFLNSPLGEESRRLSEFRVRICSQTEVAQNRYKIFLQKQFVAAGVLSDDLHKQREDRARPHILKWAEEQKRVAEEIFKRHESSLAQGVVENEKREKIRKKVWVKLYVFGKLLKAAAEDGRPDKLCGPLKKVWNKAVEVYSRKEGAVEYGQGLRLRKAVNILMLWPAAKDAFKLDSQGFPAVASKQEERQHS